MLQGVLLSDLLAGFVRRERTVMNLKEHKALLYAHEQSLRELDTLREAKNSRGTEWKIISNGDFEIPVPSDYAETALQHRIWALEAEVKEQALTLGIGAG